MFDKLHRWFQGIVVSVPEDVAACEFDCHETDCRLGDWKNCKRRLTTQAVKPQDELDLHL